MEKKAVFFTSVIYPSMFAKRDSDIVNLRRTYLSLEGLRGLMERRDVNFFCRRGNGPHIDALYKRCPGLPPVKFDIIPVSQVFLNPGDIIVAINIDDVPKPNGDGRDHSVRIMKFIRT